MLMNQRDNIILIGFMGSGKTTLGKWISQNVGFNFCDTDDYIEETTQMSINDIFQKYGEEYFRDLETKTIGDLRDKLCNTVISVGGGLPVRAQNREIMHQLGFVVYLKTSEAALVARLRGDTKRPLLAGEDVQAKIHSLMEAREALYLEAADITVTTDGKALEQIYNEIENAIIGQNP